MVEAGGTSLGKAGGSRPSTRRGASSRARNALVGDSCDWAARGSTRCAFVDQTR